MLAVDLAQTPRERLADAYWGLSTGTHEGSLSRLPLDALFALLGRAGAVEVGQKVLLLAIVALAGLGMHRLVAARSPAARVFAGVLYAANPFVYDRLYTGQWFFLLGYALLPFAAAAFLRLRAGGGALAPWGFAALAWAVGVASPHAALLLALLCACVATTWALERAWPALRRAAAAAALAALPSLYWLVPNRGVRELWSHVGEEQLDYYRAAGDPDWGLVPTLAALSGYWNNADPLREFLPGWPALAAALPALAAWGLVVAWRSAPARAVAAAGALGFLLALSTAWGPARPLFEALLEAVPPARSLREPQKALALLAFAYAYLGAHAVDDLLGWARDRRLRVAAAALLLALPVLSGYRLAGGLWGALETSEFPRSWSQADDVLRREAAGSRTLFLPFSGYLELSFAGGRLVANPSPAFFSTPILASRSVAGDPALDDTSDPVDARVRRLLARPGGGEALAACLARVGVSHVLLAREVGSERYAYLARRGDFRLVRRWPELELYRSRSPGGLVMEAAGDAACGPVARVVPARRDDAAHVTLEGPAPPPSRLLLGLPQPGSWTLRGDELRYDRWPEYRRNYLLGLLGAATFALTLAAWRLTGR